MGTPKICFIIIHLRSVDLSFLIHTNTNNCYLAHLLNKNVSVCVCEWKRILPAQCTYGNVSYKKRHVPEMPSIGPNKPYICCLLLLNNLYEAVPSLSSDKKRANERMNEMKIYNIFIYLILYTNLSSFLG